MRIAITFSTFDPFFKDTPRSCEVCKTKPSVFHFERESGIETPGELAQGFCCKQCATELLEKLQVTESAAWADEEAVIESQGVDVSAFHERRIATFGRCRD
jgi:hypothetical protein